MGLDYVAIDIVARNMGLDISFADIAAIEDGAMSVLNERA